MMSSRMWDSRSNGRGALTLVSIRVSCSPIRNLSPARCYRSLGWGATRLPIWAMAHAEILTPGY
jgi:hypothetical protein